MTLSQILKEFEEKFRGNVAVDDDVFQRLYEQSLFPTMKAFLSSKLSQAYQSGVEEAVRISDKIESEYSNIEFNEWRAFKGFRNALRDYLTSLKQDK